MPLRALLASLCAASALAVAACGGGGGGADLPGGASVAPADAALFVAIDTDFSSEQWGRATALAAQFPDAGKLLDRLQRELGQEGVDFQRDVRPALGPEVDLVLLDLERSDEVVLLTQPRDRAKLDALLEKGDDPPARAEVEGWTVLADKQAALDRFQRARARGTLAEDVRFEEALERLPEDALVKLYLDGRSVQEALERELETTDAAPFARQFGELESLALAASAEANGVRLVGDVAADTSESPAPYAAELPGELPAGALVLASFGGLDRPLRQALDAVRRAQPDFERQLGQLQAVTGLSLEEDVLPLLSGEGAIAVYPSPQELPTIQLALRLDDEEKARRVLDRIEALAQLGGGTLRSHDIAGIKAKELRLEEESFSFFYAVFDGKLVVSNTSAGIAGFRSSGPRLGDDALYRETAQSGGLPEETVGFVYADLRQGLPFLYGFLERRGEKVPDAAKNNSRALDAAILYVTREGDRFGISGFLTIK